MKLYPIFGHEFECIDIVVFLIRSRNIVTVIFFLMDLFFWWNFITVITIMINWRTLSLIYQGTHKTTFNRKARRSFVSSPFWFCPSSWNHFQKKSVFWNYQIWERTKWWIFITIWVFYNHSGCCNQCCVFNRGITAHDSFW